MSNSIRMDSHKLMLHPRRVADWLEGKQIYPIEIEVGLSGACNHRCIFCAVDYIEYTPVMLDADILISNFEILSSKGLKSIVFSGEGEPLLNQDASKVMNAAKGLGIDCALATNGVLLTKEFSETTLQSLSWIRFSIAAGTEATYKAIHQSKDGDLEIVFENMRRAVEVKRRKNLTVTLGAQLLLLPENKDEVVLLGRKLKEIGIDYYTVKPFSQHPQSKVQRQVDYSDLVGIERELTELKTDNFNVIFRKNAVDNLTHRKLYDECRGLPFMTHIDAKGNLYPCVAHVGIGKYQYGNLYKNTFEEIWENERAVKIKAHFKGSVLHAECREACRLDEINKYLQELRNPGGHVNFI